MIIQLTAPPLPAFISGGEDIYEIGKKHPDRENIGVFDLLAVTKGTLYIMEETEKFQINAGETLIIYPKGHHFSPRPCDAETHFYWFHFNTEKKWVNFSPEITNQEYKKALYKDPFKEQSFSIRLPKHCKIINWEKFEYLCKQIIEQPDSTGLGNSWELQQQLLFQQLLQELSANNHLGKSLPAVDLAEKAAAYLRRNYPAKVGYEDLGKALKFHPNHIARCMIDVFGYGPAEYLNRYRIEQAKSLLVYTDWQIERIAEACGFSQAAYFSRLFKKEEGINPSGYRKKVKSIQEK